MTEHWITSAQALEVAGGSRAICSRLKEGLITARAALLIIGDNREEDRAVPQGFWWARDNLALEQDWNTGEFSTWINQSLHCQAFGVRFPLSEVLEIAPFEKRAEIARGLSVAGDARWMTARAARTYAFDVLRLSPMTAGTAIINEARLGFVTARAVLAQGALGVEFDDTWAWQEREWNIPVWFWTDFTAPHASAQNWESGVFSGNGAGPKRTRSITLSGVHFLRDSLAAMGGPKPSSQTPDLAKAGRKPSYDWPAATNEIWRRLYGNDLRANCQADIERALITLLSNGDSGPSESTVRPYAKGIWDNYKED
jgi:hypothetical protein